MVLSPLDGTTSLAKMDYCRGQTPHDTEDPTLGPGVWENGDISVDGSGKKKFLGILSEMMFILKLDKINYLNFT